MNQQTRSPIQIFTLLLGAVISLFFLCVCVRQGPFPKSSSDVRSLMSSNSRAVTELREMEARFDANLFESIIISTPPGELTDENRERFLAISEDLSELPGVRKVFSPVEGYSDLGFPIRLMNADRSHGRFLVEIDGGLEPSERKMLEYGLEAVVKKNAELSPIRSGIFSLSEAATRNVQRENGKWTPACIVTLLVSIGFVFREFRAILAVFIPPLLTLVWLVGALLFWEIRLSPVSELSLPLLLIIGASYSAFISARFIEAYSNGDNSRLAGLRESVVLAVSTTVAGFVSLLMLDIQGVVQFGVIMIFGTIFSGLASMSITPLVVPNDETRVEKIQRSLNRFVLERGSSCGRGLVALILGISLLFSCAIPGIYIDTSPFDFLPLASDELKNFQKAGELFPGTHALAVVLLKNQHGEVFSESEVEMIDAFSKKLRGLPGVAWTVSPGDFLRFGQALERKGFDSDPAMEFGPPGIMSVDRTATRIIVETDREGAGLIDLSGLILEELRANFSPQLRKDWAFFTSSRELAIAESSLGLSRGLLLSVVTALGLVAVLLLAVFRNLTLAVYGVISSLVPILIAFGAVGMLFPALNLGAAMVAAVALGMISDNTFHYAMVFRSVRKKSSHEEAAKRAFEMSCGAFVSTALILVVGFLPTTLSTVLPIRQFGLFLSGSLLLGLGMNALLLPSMIGATPGILKDTSPE